MDDQPYLSPTLEAPLRAQPLGLFPTMNSLEDVVASIEARLPITSKNEMVALLATYHNTLLHILQTQQ